MGVINHLLTGMILQAPLRWWENCKGIPPAKCLMSPDVRILSDISYRVHGMNGKFTDPWMASKCMGFSRILWYNGGFTGNRVWIPWMFIWVVLIVSDEHSWAASSRSQVDPSKESQPRLGFSTYMLIVGQDHYLVAKMVVTIVIVSWVSSPYLGDEFQP